MATCLAELSLFVARTVLVVVSVRALETAQNARIGIKQAVGKHHANPGTRR
jgi:hypothetical protein